MNGATITQGLTLTNPDALHTVDELRGALHAANGALIELSGRFHEMSQVAHEATTTIALLIRAQRESDSETVLRMLRELEESLMTPTAQGAEEE